MRDQLKEMFDNNLSDENYEEERRRKEEEQQMYLTLLGAMSINTMFGNRRF